MSVLPTRNLDRRKFASAGGPRLRILCLAAREPSWVNLGLSIDADSDRDGQFVWMDDPAEAIARLRDESFCCILVDDDPQSGRDGLTLLEGMRNAGYTDPVVVATSSDDESRWAKLYACDCEVLAAKSRWDSPALWPLIRRAMHHAESRDEHSRLATSDRRRLEREREEVERLLVQQRRLLGRIQALWDPHESPSPPPAAHRRLDAFYGELLRTYVMMGTGGLDAEVSELARLLADAGFTPQQTLDLHLTRVAALVEGLGNRSSRHVMHRADLLALELMLRLGERYQLAAGGGGVDASAAG